MIEKLIIRDFSSLDDNAVWNLHELALKATQAFISDSTLDQDLHNIKDEYQKNGGVFLVGTLGHAIIAMGALKKISNEIAEVKRIRVHPDFQRKGFGQEILSELEKRARKLGFRKLTLDTTVKQLAAQKLYLKNGFYEVNRHKELIYFEKLLT